MFETFAASHKLRSSQAKQNVFQIEFKVFFCENKKVLVFLKRKKCFFEFTFNSSDF